MTYSVTVMLSKAVLHLVLGFKYFYSCQVNVDTYRTPGTDILYSMFLSSRRASSLLPKVAAKFAHSLSRAAAFSPSLLWVASHSDYSRLILRKVNKC